MLLLTYSYLFLISICFVVNIDFAYMDDNSPLLSGMKTPYMRQLFDTRMQSRPFSRVAHRRFWRRSQRWPMANAAVAVCSHRTETCIHICAWRSPATIPCSTINNKIRIRSRAAGFLTYDSLICCCFSRCQYLCRGGREKSDTLTFIHIRTESVTYEKRSDVKSRTFTNIFMIAFQFGIRFFT